MADYRPGIDGDAEEQGLGSGVSDPLGRLGLTAEQVQRNPALLQSLQQAGVMPQKQETAPAATPVAAPDQGVSASVPPAAAAPPPTDSRGYAIAGLDLLDQSGRKANKAADEISLTNPEVDRLTAQRGRLATPAPLYDTKTGKMLPKTQEFDPVTGHSVDVNPNVSKGQKIWRGVRGGLIGLAAGGPMGALVGALEPQILSQPGYGAPSKAYQRAEERRGEELTATDASLKTAFDNWKEQQGAAGKRATEYRANAALGKDETTGATTLMERDQTSPAGKAAVTEAEFGQYSQQADRLGLKGYIRAQYIGNKGKLPNPERPERPSEADYNAASYTRALATYNQQRGKPANTPPATLEDFNAVQEATRGTMNKGKQGGPTPQQETAANDKKNRAIATANASYAKNFNTQEYQTNLQDAQNAFEQDAQIIGAAGPHVTVTVDNYGKVTWTPDAAPTQAAPAGVPAGAGAGPAAAPAPPATRNDTPTTPRPPGATGVIRGKSDQKLYWWDGKKKLGVAQ